MDSLNDIVADYHERFGNPEYRYSKKQIAWSPRRGRPGEHIIPISGGPEITREEYDANIAEYERVRRLAFLGKYPHSYWRYEKTMVKEGWREHLIRDVEQYDCFPANRTPPAQSDGGSHGEGG